MSLVNIVLNEDQTEGTKATVSQWLSQLGEKVEKNQAIVELETDKVMMEVIAPESGVLKEIVLHSDEEVKAGGVLGIIDTEANSTIEKKPIIENPVESSKIPLASHPKQKTDRCISPAVRRLIQQHDIAIDSIGGTGKDGRVTSRDVQQVIDKSPETQSSELKSQHRPITAMRKSIAKHMVESLLHTAPHVTSVFHLDLSAIIAHRKAHKQDFANNKSKLTFTAYFIAASAMAIKKNPLINSQLHDDSIEVFDSINIGIGTALADEGLIVPVLKNCENKDLAAIAKELTELTDKARHNKLKPSDVQQGTFTISNHGVSGSLLATPIIINQPQSAILGIGKMEKKVLVKELNGEDVMVIKPMCYVTLTIDHRVLDAHQCNQFLSVFVDILENWSL